MSAARTLRLITFFCFLILLVLTLPPVLSFEQADMPQRGAMISPSAKSTGAGAEFFVDVVVYPFIEGRTSPTSQLINNYQLAVGYNQNDLTFVRAETLLPRFELTHSESLGTLYLEGIARNIIADYFNFQATPLARLYFISKKEVTTQVTVSGFTAENNFGLEGRPAVLVDQYQPSSVTITSGSACTPNCAGKTCGSDGCGGFCGTPDGLCATPGNECQNGQCVCIPDCNMRECGDNGCGGTCGTCSSGTSCNGVQCVVGQASPKPIYEPKQVSLSSQSASSDRGGRQPAGPDERLRPYAPSGGVGGGLPPVPVVQPPVAPPPVPEPVAPPVPEEQEAEEPVLIEEPAVLPPVPPVQKKKFPWWIIIVIIAVILGGLGYYYYQKKKKNEALYGSIPPPGAQPPSPPSSPLPYTPASPQSPPRQSPFQQPPRPPTF